MKTVKTMRIALFISALFCQAWLWSQTQTKVQQAPADHFIIVQLHIGENVDNWFSQLPTDMDLQYAKRLSSNQNIHLLQAPNVVQDRWLQILKQHRAVKHLQLDGEVEFRSDPNDPLFSEQWNVQRISAEEAWSRTTGGLTAGGDTIVVAIMDRGFEPFHQDLVNNIWVNHGEQADDGIDNDNNGYVDDIYGWDYWSESPNIAPDYHGLGVAGIIGANGDNNLGITGINWNIKLMYFSFRRISNLIRAYDYVIDQRQRYNESDGAEGSFVVATNASFGQENVFCERQPAWAAMYDAMGAVGILTGVGAANRNIDVEQLGDMPTTCTTDFIITTCNTTEQDRLGSTSAFGAVSVDIGSPGDGSLTTAPANQYGTFSRNSAAAPHLTGAIAFLYSLPEIDLGQMAITEPVATARLIRQMVIAGVDTIPALKGKTVTGGRLNLARSEELLRTSLVNELTDLNIDLIYPNPAILPSITVRYGAPSNGDYLALIINSLGQEVLRQTVTISEIGQRLFTLPVDFLPNGTYFLRFGKDDNWVAKPFVVYQ